MSGGSEGLSSLGLLRNTSILGSDLPLQLRGGLQAWHPVWPSWHFLWLRVSHIGPHYSLKEENK